LANDLLLEVRMVLALRIVPLAGLLSAIVMAQGIATLRPGPWSSPQEIAALESKVLQNPDDLGAQRELLQVYASIAPPRGYDDPARRSVRLQHILYLVEHHPEAAVSASRAAFVDRAHGPYANPSDHEAVRHQWLAAVQAHTANSAIILNAVKFLEVDDQNDAEQVLRRSVNADPQSREMAANLGFLYARESFTAGFAKHAAEELERSNNGVVLAAAGTALANLAKSFDSVNGTMIEFGEKLLTRARELAPDDPDIQGLMPLIQYFAPEQVRFASAIPQATNAPTRIRVGENVQAANLIRKTEPQYPEEARNAGITGEVRVSVIIGRDGRIQTVQLISGNPRLLEAAIQAIEMWEYIPTLLNGSPVEVETTATVAFPQN
jgi:TonB family protein